MGTPEDERHRRDHQMLRVYNVKGWRWNPAARRWVWCLDENTENPPDLKPPVLPLKPS